MEPEEILKKLKLDSEVIKHLKAVSDTAFEIAERVKIPVDKQLIFTGAMLHDIGRSITHDITHVSEGARLAENLGLDDRVVNIIRRHVGAGLTSDEAIALGLPAGDYMPETPEEKIVAYADNITVGSKRTSFDENIKLFEKKLGKKHPAVERMKKLQWEITSWMI